MAPANQIVSVCLFLVLYPIKLFVSCPILHFSERELHEVLKFCITEIVFLQISGVQLIIF